MADNLKPLQIQAATLYGAGCVVGDTQIILSSFKKLDGSNVVMTDLGVKGYGTIEPGKLDQEDPISFTGVVQNSNGTATLTGVQRNSGFAPYTETPGVGKDHSGGVVFVISNTAQFYNDLSIKNNDEDISGTWTFTDPNVPRMNTAHTYGAGEEEYLTTKRYVDSVAIAGAPKADNATYGITRLSLAPAVAGTPIAVGDNDTRLPSQTENDALVGTSGTPSSTNKYVTNDDTSATAAASKVVRAGAGGKIVEGYLQTTDANITDLTDGGDTTLHTHTDLSSGQNGVNVTGGKKYLNFSPKFLTALNLNVSNVTATYYGHYMTGSTSVGANGSQIFFSVAGVYGLSSKNYSAGKRVVVDFWCSVNNTTTNNIAFGLTSGAILYNDAATKGVCFTIDNSSKLYAHTSNGTGGADHTEDEITGITLTNVNNYRIEFTPGTSALFYVNGTLKKTIASTLPTTGDITFGVGTSDAGATKSANMVNLLIFPDISIQL
jgi:hypothetical protein